MWYCGRSYRPSLPRVWCVGAVRMEEGTWKVFKYCCCALEQSLGPVQGSRMEAGGWYEAGWWSKTPAYARHHGTFKAVLGRWSLPLRNSRSIRGVETYPSEKLKVNPNYARGTQKWVAVSSASKSGVGGAQAPRGCREAGRRGRERFPERLLEGGNGESWTEVLSARQSREGKGSVGQMEQG